MLIALVHKLTISAERPLLAGEVSANFCGLRVPRGHVTDPYGRILGFLDWLLLLLLLLRKVHGLSPRANYTGQATAPCRQS
jgi:hypothetical protein